MSRGLLTKRLAGPSFSLNVRFDQANMTRRKEYSRGTLVKFGSCATDFIADHEVFDVKEGEILVAKKQPGRVSDGFARVFSSLNGTVQEVDEDSTKTAVLASHEFIGVAVTEHKAEKIAKFDQGFVACVSGVLTVMNESGSTLHPGQPLTFGIGEKPPMQHGIHPKKSRFVFKKWKPDRPLIGKVLSYSKNGNTMDILLHPQRRR